MKPNVKLTIDITDLTGDDLDRAAILSIGLIKDAIQRRENTGDSSVTILVGEEKLFEDNDFDLSDDDDDES